MAQQMATYERGCNLLVSIPPSTRTNEIISLQDPGQTTFRFAAPSYVA